MFDYAKFAQIFIATFATESSQEITIWQVTIISLHVHEKTQKIFQLKSLKIFLHYLLSCFSLSDLQYQPFYLHGLMQYDFQSQSVSQN